MRCKTCFYNSFLSNSKSKFWSHKNKENPRYVTKCNGNKFYFNCSLCSHEFELRLNDISKNQWCAYCNNKKLCKNKCEICYNKSFLSNPKSVYWSDKNKSKPREVFKNSNKKFYFNCNLCSHEFENRLYEINLYNHWCIYCKNQKLCEEQCDICYKKSFASHHKSKFWSNKNKLNCRNVFLNSHSKFWFNCEKCNNSFKSVLYSITRLNTWCPICVNKSEKLLYDYFIENNINFIKEYKIINGKYKNSNTLFRYDFYLQDVNILIELDGRQHFIQIKYWKNNVKINQLRDCYKMKFAINNIVNVKIIRINQEDIHNNLIDYKNIFNNLLKNNNLAQITYISSNENLYNNHKEFMNLNITELY
jgi:very-short-patch-repair endonuclease